MTTLSNEPLPFSDGGKGFRPIEENEDVKKLLAAQRQAILKEVREGAVDVYWDEHNSELVQAVPLAYLDAMEKKVS